MLFDARHSRRLRMKRAATGMTRFGPVKIVDLSPTGLGVCHDSELEQGATTWLEFRWADIMIRLECEVRSSRPSKGESKFASGLLVRGGSSAVEYRKRVEAEIARMKAADEKLPPLI